MKRIVTSLLLSFVAAITVAGQTEVKFMTLVDEDVQYFQTNPKTLIREPLQVDRKVGMMFSEPIFSDFYREMEASIPSRSATASKLLAELSRTELLELIYIERGQGGEFLMLRSAKSGSKFQQQIRLFFKTVEKFYPVKFVYGDFEVPITEESPSKQIVSSNLPSWTKSLPKSIIRAQSQANTLAVTRVAREEIPLK